VRVYARVLVPPNLYIHTYTCPVRVPSRRSGWLAGTSWRQTSAASPPIGPAGARVAFNPWVTSLPQSGPTDSVRTTRAEETNSNDFDLRQSACRQGVFASFGGISLVSPAISRRRAPARLRQLEPRMRLAVHGVPKGALRTQSA